MTRYKMEEVLPLLEERVRRYTHNESTSVTYEKARQLMESLLYCLEEGENGNGMDIMAGEGDVKTAFTLGLARKKEKIKLAEELFEKIRKDFHSYHNHGYEETVMKGMPAFFLRYDIEFDGKNHLLTLDYPLFLEIEELTGIDLIYAYLKAARIEQDFLKHFPTLSVEEILRGFNGKYEEAYFNISEIVLYKALGCIMVKRPAGGLFMTEEDIMMLSKQLQERSKEELESKLQDALLSLDKELHLQSEVSEYFMTGLPKIVSNFLYYKKIKKVFLLFPKRKQKMKLQQKFQDGRVMEDEALRILIEKMQACESLEDRLYMVKENVRSLRDLKEILKECFWGDEFIQVFSLLSQEEVMVLKKEMKGRIAFGKGCIYKYLIKI